MDPTHPGSDLEQASLGSKGEDACSPSVHPPDVLGCLQTAQRWWDVPLSMGCVSCIR